MHVSLKSRMYIRASSDLAVTAKKNVNLEKRENLTSTWMYSFLRAVSIV